MIEYYEVHQRMTISDGNGLKCYSWKTEGAVQKQGPICARVSLARPFQLQKGKLYDELEHFASKQRRSIQGNYDRPKRIQIQTTSMDKCLLMQAHGRMEHFWMKETVDCFFLSGETADECDAIQTLMLTEVAITHTNVRLTNLTSDDLIYDEAGTSYDSNTLSEVQDHDAYLEADMSEVHDESKLISKLEREYLNLQLKYQHLQESFDNKNSQASQEAPDFNSFFKIKNLEHQIQEKDNVIRHLKDRVANVNDRSCVPYNAIDVTALVEQNDCYRVELEKVKQHYKEMYDSIKITRAHTSEKTSTMLNEIESLKAQLRSKEQCFTSDYVKPKVLAPGMYAIDVKPIPHPLKNNRSAHLNYISHLKESVETVREIVEEARVVKPLDSSLNYACRYTKLSQELLECVIGTCPKSFNERDNKAPFTPVPRKQQVTFSDKPGTSSSNTQKHKVHQRVQQTNMPVLPSTGVNDSTEASGSKPRSNTKKNRILPAKKEVEVRLRTNKSVWTKVNPVDSSTSSKRVVINSNSESVCKTCRTGHTLVYGLRLFKTYDGELFKAHEICGKVHRDMSSPEYTMWKDLDTICSL
ncbi:hypothetical protein Tco_0743615 [Tanacetum coccineum]